MQSIVKQDANDQHVVGLWLSKRQGGPNTLRSYSSTAQKFLLWCNDRGVGIRTLTLEHLIDWRDQIPGTPSTVGQRLAAVKSLLTFAARVGYVPFNVGQAVEKPRMVRKRVRIMTQAEVKLIISEAKAQGETNSDIIGIFLSLLYYSGCRISEVIDITRENIEELPNGTTVLNVIGKGYRPRSVIIPSWLSQKLSGNPRVFPWGVRQAREIVYQAARNVGLDGISPHSFRHACASHAISNGAGLDVVKDHLGHASLTTTSFYVHATEGAANYLQEI